MQILIPRTGLNRSIFFSCALIVLTFPIQLWVFTPLVMKASKENKFTSEPIIVIRCVDWVKDTLLSYDLDFVTNNPLTTGNPNVLASPQTEGALPQTVPSGAWREEIGTGPCNFVIQEVNTDSIRNLGFVYANVIGGEGACKLSLFWRDSVEYSSCEKIQKTGIYAKIYRRWSLICSGARKDTVQVIAFAQPKVQDFKFNGEGSDSFDRFVHYQVCSTDKNLIKREDVTPYVYSYFHTAIYPKFYYIDQPESKYSIRQVDRDFPFCGTLDTNGVRILREMYVFDSCTGTAIDTFRLHIRIGNFNPVISIPTTVPDLLIDSADCSASFTVGHAGFKKAFGIEVNGCYSNFISEAIIKAKDRYRDGILVAENTWDKLKYSIQNGTVSGLAPGRYRVLFSVGTVCYGYARDSFEFEVKDKTGPKPICVNGLSVNLQPDGQGGGKYILKAIDFVGTGVYDCHGQGPDTLKGQKLVTHYSINKIGEKVDSSQKSLEVTCLENGKVILVELHAWDIYGQNDYCLTYVEVHGGGIVNCGIVEPLVLSGNISTEGNSSVQNVNVQLSGKASQKILSRSSGGYWFYIWTEGDYTITPSLDTHPLNGISTFDLLLIQKHILGIQALNSPYKMIAADINNSRSITTLDLIQLRKLILGLDVHFANNTSWRFVDANYVFPDVRNPWSANFPEAVTIRLGIDSRRNASFVAIKIGDLNSSAKTNDWE